MSTVWHHPPHLVASVAGARAVYWRSFRTSELASFPLWRSTPTSPSLDGAWRGGMAFHRSRPRRRVMGDLLGAAIHNHGLGGVPLHRRPSRHCSSSRPPSTAALRPSPARSRRSGLHLPTAAAAPCRQPKRKRRGEREEEEGKGERGWQVGPTCQWVTYYILCDIFFNSNTT